MGSEQLSSLRGQDQGFGAGVGEDGGSDSRNSRIAQMMAASQGFPGGAGDLGSLPLDLGGSMGGTLPVDQGGRTRSGLCLPQQRPRALREGIATQRFRGCYFGIHGSSAESLRGHSFAV